MDNKKLNFKVDNILFDYRLFDTLKAIKSTNSQRKAADKLKISHSVLNRRILDAEEKLSQKLVMVSNKGSVLTDYANNLLDIYESYELRLIDDDILSFAGGPISSEFVRQLAMAYRVSDIQIIETDVQNAINLAQKGMVDILGFDDPVQAYLLDLEPIPLGRDSLMLLSHDVVCCSSFDDLNGFKYVEVEGSAQRLAWNTLSNNDIDFDIVCVVNSFHEAIRLVENTENLHTFINKSMSYRCQNLNNILSEQTRHIISAINVKNDSYVENFLNFASHRAQKLTLKYGFEQL